MDTEEKETFEIECEIVRIFYDDSIISMLKKRKSIILGLNIIIKSKNSTLYVNGAPSPAYFELGLTQKDFKELTGLDWDGTENKIEELRKNLIGLKYSLDLGIKKALEKKNKNKIVVVFPSDISAHNALLFCVKYVDKENISTDKESEAHIFIITPPKGKEEEILEKINNEGFCLGIIAIKYENYLNFKEISKTFAPNQF